MDLPATPDTDPFAEVKSPDPLRNVPTLDLRDLISQEARLADLGLTCHRKDEEWLRPSCSTCPLVRTPDVIPLCKIGMAQERAMLAAGDVLAAA